MARHCFDLVTYENHFDLVTQENIFEDNKKFDLGVRARHDRKVLASICIAQTHRCKPQNRTIFAKSQMHGSVELVLDKLLWNGRNQFIGTLE